MEIRNSVFGKPYIFNASVKNPIFLMCCLLAGTDGCFETSVILGVICPGL